MPNTSASGGYLAPQSAVPSSDDAFEDFLQSVVAGITGLAGDKVRPRYQQGSIPIQPPASVDWCAVGPLSSEPMAQRAQIRHDPTGTIVAAGDGVDIITTWETTEVMASMYGPNAWRNAGFLSDGLMVPQNREALFHARVQLRRIGGRIQTSEILHQAISLRRVDIRVEFVRAIVREYPVFNLLSAQGAVVRRAAGTGQNVSESFTTPPAP